MGSSGLAGMNRELVGGAVGAGSLGFAVALGVLAAAATIAQMVAPEQGRGPGVLGGAGLGRCAPAARCCSGPPLLRSGLLWGREVAAQRGAVRVKSELRERLFAHVLRLGPAYTRGERTGELATTATEGIEKLDAYFGRYLPQVCSERRSFRC